jgi:stearoyl-CoA desaturase (delta-9 desaturase)
MFVSTRLFGLFSEVGIHRYYTHKTFSVKQRWKEHLMKLFAFLAGQGAILSWVTVHRHHHAYEDSNGDPHSPLLFPAWKIYLGLFPTDYKKNLVTDLIRHHDRRYFIFENNYYWLLWTALWIVSFLISPLLFFIIVSGSAGWYAVTAIVNILLHGNQIGYKKYTDAVATNSAWLDKITGAGYHNNHHKNPGSYTYSLDGSEPDWIGSFIKKFADSTDNSVKLRHN